MKAWSAPATQIPVPSSTDLRPIFDDMQETHKPLQISAQQGTGGAKGPKTIKVGMSWHALDIYSPHVTVHCSLLDICSCNLRSWQKSLDSLWRHTGDECSCGCAHLFKNLPLLLVASSYY